MTNTGKCLAYNQCKRMVQNYTYNKSFYCKQMHKKDWEEMCFSDAFSRNTTVAVGILVRTFLFSMLLLSTFFAVFRYHCFYGNLFQKFRREQEQNMQYTHHPRCVFFLQENQEKKKKQEADLKGMIPASGKFWREEEGWIRKKMVQWEAGCLDEPLSNCWGVRSFVLLGTNAHYLKGHA